MFSKLLIASKGKASRASLHAGRSNQPVDISAILHASLERDLYSGKRPPEPPSFLSSLLKTGNFCSLFCWKNSICLVPTRVILGLGGKSKALIYDKVLTSRIVLITFCHRWKQWQTNCMFSYFFSIREITQLEVIFICIVSMKVNWLVMDRTTNIP